MRHSGSCHCQSIQLILDSQHGAKAIVARACQCSFCRKNGINWYSDPNGQLLLKYAATLRPTYYRFGMKLADFVICPRCGVCVAAIKDDDSQPRAVVNLNCLDYDWDWSKNTISMDFDSDSKTERSDRHQQNWMPFKIITY